MSKHYYYFAASLPLLDFDVKPLISVEEFVEDCTRLLSAEDAKMIRASLTADDSFENANQTFKKYTAFDNNLRNELVYLRTQRLKKDAANYMHGNREADPIIMEAAANALKQEDLLEAEKILDRVRWNYLETLAYGHNYDFEFIFIYGLKLKILERYEHIKSTRGSEIFEELKHVSMPTI